MSENTKVEAIPSEGTVKVRALERSNGEGGWTLPVPLLEAIQREAVEIEGWASTTPLEVIEAVSLVAERRVLSCLSTHTAAGAGPVGEAVADICFPHEAWQVAGHFFETREEAQQAADSHDLWAEPKQPRAWRPVEEPGEVERLTRERDALAEALEQINSTSLSEVFDGRICEIVSAAREVLAGRFDFNAHSLKVDLARETKRAETAEAALAAKQERLEKVEAQAAANGRAGIEAAARYVEALWNAHTKEFGVYDYSTNVTEFSGSSEDIDCLYQELIEGIRSLDAARVDRARAALKGDA